MEKANAEENLQRNKTFVRMFPVCILFGFLLVFYASLVSPEWLQPVFDDPLAFVLSSVFLGFGLDVWLWSQDEKQMKKREGKF